MALENYGRIMQGASDFAMQPYNALQDARRNQRTNTLLDLRAQQVQGEIDDDAEWDQAFAARDINTLRRIDPTVAGVIEEQWRAEKMAGLEEIPVRQKIDMAPLQRQENWAAEQSQKRKQDATQNSFEAQRIGIQRAQEARLSQEPDAGQKAPDGYRWKGDGSLEAIPGGPKDMEATQPMSPKDTNTARVKLTQVKVARQQLERAKKAYESIQNSFSAGPGGQFVPTPKGQAFDAAIDTMRGSITALTRVPGVGAMSDYETRLDQGKFPTRGKYEETAKQQLADLELLLDTIEQGYGEMLGTKPAEAQKPAVRRRFNPETGKIE